MPPPPARQRDQASRCHATRRRKIFHKPRRLRCGRSPRRRRRLRRRGRRPQPDRRLLTRSANCLRASPCSRPRPLLFLPRAFLPRRCRLGRCCPALRKAPRLRRTPCFARSRALPARPCRTLRQQISPAFSRPSLCQHLLNRPMPPTPTANRSTRNRLWIMVGCDVILTPNVYSCR